MPTIAIGSSLPVLARTATGALLCPAASSLRKEAAAAVRGGWKTRVEGRRRPVAAPRRLRSSTAPSESKPRSLKATVGSIAAAEAWPRTVATCSATRETAGPSRSAGGTAARGGGAAGAEGAGVEGDDEGDGGGEPAAALEQLQALLVGDGAGATPGDPGPVGDGDLAGHAALQRPGSPGDRGGRESLGPTTLGERVEEGVGGGVAALAGAGEGGGDRGEEDELGEVGVPGQLVQVPGGAGLGRHHRLQALRGERLDDPVVDDAGGVDHGVEGVLGRDRVEQLGERGAVGDVAGGDPHLGASILRP